MTTGERETDPTEASIVERIFREFIAGVSPKQIAKNLNREGIAGPFGGAWSPSTIYGSSKRGTGILNNELYIGRLVWNRLRRKFPDSVSSPTSCGRTRSRARSAADTRSEQRAIQPGRGARSTCSQASRSVASAAPDSS